MKIILVFFKFDFTFYGFGVENYKDDEEEKNEENEEKES